MKRKKTLKNRLNYWFDNILSKGSAALISWLAVLSLILILGVSAVANYTRAALDQNGKPLSFLQVVWMSLMRAMDSGTIAGDSGGFLFMALMLLVTLGGIFIVSTLIGILNTGIEQKLDNLRKGKSFVVEHGHTIILGWSSHVTAIISELVVANSNKRHSCIVILADRDKVEMEDEIRSKLGSTGRTRIVCRSGNPMRLNDLAMVNPNDSKTILVLAPDEGDPDIQVIKTILAITNNPDRRRAPYHIVAEVHDLGRDRGVVAADIAIGRLDGLHVGVEGGLRERTARLQLHHVGELGVLDLLVALEEHLVDHLVLGHGDNQRRTDLVDLHVGEQTGAEQAFDGFVDIAARERFAGLDRDIVADGVGIDARVATHFDPAHHGGLGGRNGNKLNDERAWNDQGGGQGRRRSCTQKLGCLHRAL